MDVDIAKRLACAKEEQPTYSPNAATKKVISHKSLIMLVGPCAVGKSYVIAELTALNPDFGKVRSISTREPRPDDASDTMQLYPKTNQGLNELLTEIESGAVVSYVIHPTTGDIYGTLKDSYPARYNLLPTLASSVANYKKLPFLHTYTIGLVATPQDWQQWLNEREFASPNDYAKRINEAILSLEWLLTTPSASIICNQAGTPKQTAKKIQHAVTTQAITRDEPAAMALLAYARNLATIDI